MKPCFFLLFWIPLVVSAQVSDNFDDGDFTGNPRWTGSTEKFIVNGDNRLQLKDTTAGEAWLVTKCSLEKNTEWRFWVKYSFSPSSNNNGRIYLITSDSVLSADPDGYYIQLGESGSNDALELFAKHGDNPVSVCRGTEGFIASSFEISVKVTRDSAGNWKLYADPAGEQQYVLQAAGYNNDYSGAGYLGFYCKYTKSNSSKFYFDNVFAGTIEQDTVRPSVNSVIVLNDTSLSVVFSEGVEKESAESVQNYFLKEGHINPVAAVRQENGREIILLFDNSFISGEHYVLHVENISDFNGNVMQPVEISFYYYIPVSNDIIFNEIMADPSPPVQLPEYEYLELFNRSSYDINLSGWKMVIGTSEKTFENAIISAGGFLIVGKSSASDAFNDYGTFYGFGSFSLKNSGQDLWLYDQYGHMIDNVSYSDDWYKDDDKSDGGWSLEKINPDDICSGEENWKASVDAKGGTPGAQNSVFGNTTLFTQVKKLQMEADNILALYFSQRMNPVSISKPSLYSVNGNIGEPLYVYTFENRPEKVELYFENSFITGKSYTLTVSHEVKNCIGVSMKNDTLLIFGLPDSAGVGDIVINEVLFNPLGDGVDYVELYNNSGKILDLSQLVLGAVNGDPPAPPDTTAYSVAGEQTLFPSGEYRLLTSSPQKVSGQYYSPFPENLIKMSSFPSYPNDKGTVLLISTTGDVIDAFHYSESMQYPLLNSFEGVALERISFDAPTDDPNNWHSAAETVGFGTPGYQNSQFYNSDDSAFTLVIDPEIFSPDNDGYNDVTHIVYRFNDPGYSLSVYLFDREGHPVRKLAENVYTGTGKGLLVWDGLRDDGTKASIGIYLVYIRVFDLNGNVKEYRKTVVVGGSLH